MNKILDLDYNKMRPKKLLTVCPKCGYNKLDISTYVIVRGKLTKGGTAKIQRVGNIAQRLPWLTCINCGWEFDYDNPLEESMEDPYKEPKDEDVK